MPSGELLLGFGARRAKEQVPVINLRAGRVQRSYGARASHQHPSDHQLFRGNFQRNWATADRQHPLHTTQVFPRQILMTAPSQCPIRQSSRSITPRLTGGQIMGIGADRPFQLAG